MKMAVTEVPCLNSDKGFKVANSSFALHKSINAHFSKLTKSDQNSSFSRIYQGERPYPTQQKSLFHSSSLNSRVLFTIVILESFLWRNRHKYSLIERGAFWLVALVFGNLVYTKHTRPFLSMWRGGRRQTIFPVDPILKTRVTIDTRYIIHPTISVEVSPRQVGFMMCSTYRPEFMNS